MSDIQNDKEGDPRAPETGSWIQRRFNPYGFSPGMLALQAVLCLGLSVLTLDLMAHAALRLAADSTGIVVVSSESCPWSRAAKAHLDARSVPYRVIESQRNPLLSAFALWTHRSLRVPIVVIGDEVVRGYSEEAIDAALARRPGASAPASRR